LRGNFKEKQAVRETSGQPYQLTVGIPCPLSFFSENHADFYGKISENQLEAKNSPNKFDEMTI
jgi:hypothetical protein